MCATLVDQWVRDGLRHAMVAPGSRSTPMALAIAARDELSLDVFHDERSAAFAALGCAASSGVPALVLCTSGTAATHLHGAVVEAHLSRVPMIVVTADRPPELRDVGAAQTIDQTKLFGAAVRWYHDPGVAAHEASHTWRALARNSFDRSLGGDAGPVHLNLPFREPLVAEPDELPDAYLGAREAVPAVLPAVAGTVLRALDAARGVIIAGRGVDDVDAVMEFAARRGWPVLADPRSGCRGAHGAVAAFDGILREPHFAAMHRPEVVLHLGEPPASKVTAQWLAALEVPQVRLTVGEAVIDPSHRITHRMVGPVGQICRSLAGREWSTRPDEAWATEWTAASMAAEAALEAVLEGPDDRTIGWSGLSEPAVARAVSRLDRTVVVASSMPVRDVEWFGAARQQASVWSNRGANGIDGTVATAIGIARAEGRPVVVLLGDVALLHDASSLTALARRDVEVKIVVVDNDGGGIFSFLPQASSLDVSRFEQLFGTPHGTDLELLAASHRLRSVTVDSLTELDGELARPGSACIRVPSDRTANLEVHASLQRAVVDAVAALAADR